MKAHHFFKSSIILLFAVFTFGCEKGGISMENTEIGIDPENNFEGLNRVLQGRGYFLDEELPEATTASGLGINVSNTIKKIETAEGESIVIPFTVADIGPAKVCGINIQVLDAFGYWKMPVTHNVVNDYYAEFTIPRFVKPGEMSFVFNVEVCYDGKTYVSKKDTTTITFQPELACGDSLTGRGIGLIIRKFNLGSKKGKAKIFWRPNFVGDRLDIRQGKNYIFSTGSLLGQGRYPSCSLNGFVSSTPGKFLSYEMDFDPAKGQSVLAFCFGNCGNNVTEWDLFIECPQ